MNDLIQIIKVLDQDQIKDLNKHFDNLKLQKNEVFDDSDGTKVDDVMRSSTGTFLSEDDDITKKFHLKINKALDEYKKRVEKIHPNFGYYPVPGGYDTKSWREAIQVLQYEKSQEYKFHHDAGTREEQAEYHRKISVIVYLTEDFKGGGTSFPHVTFKPKPGYGLFFPSNWCFPHAGEKVEEGIKRVAVTWYYVQQT